MTDLLTALGLMLVLEGAMYALFPDGMRRMMAYAQTLPPAQLRTTGLVLAAFGFLIVAVIRGY
jgi:uncharacterized protein